ncbi:unnamed protein product, partial [Ixodes hexagonus]
LLHREQPIFSTKAHVFHIDPKTKRSWIPASSQAVSVSFFFDSTRNLYRIISVEGTKAVINSTITPNMTFTKTSQKFGQWSDIRANTVYGLGFGSEPDLNKFIEKFQEVKEATRLAAQKANGSAGTASPSPMGTLRPPSACDQTAPDDASAVGGEGDGRAPLVAHQRSQSLSGLQASSPKHQARGAGPDKASLPQSTAEAQLRYENDRLKLALAQSSANAKKWEVELQTLKNNNARLTCALQESTSNVEEWKRQLQALKEENAAMRNKASSPPMIELEASHGNPDAIAELRKEIGSLRTRSDLLDREGKQKDKWPSLLRRLTLGSLSPRQALLSENDGLKGTVTRLQEQLEASRSSSRGRQGAWEQLNQRFSLKLHELRDLQHEMASLLNS